MSALDALLAAATVDGDSETHYTCPDCSGTLRKTLLGGLDPLTCTVCGGTRWSK